MTKIHAQILTTWTVDADGANTPVFPFMLAEGDSWSDISATPAANLTPDPNLILLECWLDEKSYQAVLDDKDYGEEAVYWSEKIVEDVVNAV